MTPIDRKCIEAGISRKELAQRSGIPYVTIDQWARRKRLPRDVYQLCKVAKVLDCHIEDLIEPELEKKPRRRELPRRKKKRHPTKSDMI